MLYRLIRPLLFIFPPEAAHRIVVVSFRLLFALPLVRGAFCRLWGDRLQSASLEVRVAGLRLRNRLGIAAGMDKNGKNLKLWHALGFGFVEVGTVTVPPQGGNPRPRLFRLKAQKALLNRMGMNGDGLDRVISRLRKAPRGGHGLTVGLSVGMASGSSLPQAILDYRHCYREASSLVDYLALNLSSPNTPKLRSQLIGGEPLRILRALGDERKGSRHRRPIFVKISPDMTLAEVDQIVGAILETGMDGIIATNTSVDLGLLKEPRGGASLPFSGGISGAPLSGLSTSVVRHLRERAPDLPLIGVGGIRDAVSAAEKLEAGADLIQVYTGLIYRGPGLVADILASPRMRAKAK